MADKKKCRRALESAAAGSIFFGIPDCRVFPRGARRSPVDGYIRKFFDQPNT